MPLYQPSNISPSLLGAFGSGVVISNYPSNDNYTTISWQVNGTTPMTAFEITIRRIDMPTTRWWSSGKLTTNCPFYPSDGNGNQQLFSFTTLYKYLHDPADGGYSGSSPGVTSGQTYLMYITQYWQEPDSNGVLTEQSITMTSPAKFYTRNKGTVTITGLNNGDSLTGRTQSFTATYGGGSSIDSVISARWTLCKSSGDLILDTGWLSTQVLYFSYNGFAPGSSYSIQCGIETENGVVVESDVVSFSIANNYGLWIGEIKACPAPQYGGVVIDWGAISDIPGTNVNGYPLLYNLSSYILRNVDEILWDTVNGEAMEIGGNWTVVWKGWVTESGRYTPLLFKVGTTTFLSVRFDLDFGKITLRSIGGISVTHATLNVPLRVGMGFTIIITPTSIVAAIFGTDGEEKYAEADGEILNFNDADNNYMPYLFLDEDDVLHGVYALNTYSPLNQQRVIVAEDLAVDLPISKILGVQLSGPQDCAYLWILNKPLPTSTTETLLFGKSFTPTWDEDNTQFLARFDTASIDAGNTTLTGAFQGVDLYRRSGSIFQYIGSTDQPAGYSMVDFGVKSADQSYTYTIFINDEGNGSQSNPTSTKPCLWDWTLISCTDNGNNQFTPTAFWRFRYNVSSGTMSNSNSPSVLQNFTPYPTVLMASANYKSGTLTGYIGSVSNGQYTESISARDALFALSTNSEPLFLRSRKGDFLRVAITGPITAGAADNTRQQAQQISVPWAEIADASMSSVVLTPEDDLYNEIFNSGEVIEPLLG